MSKNHKNRLSIYGIIMVAAAIASLTFSVKGSSIEDADVSPTEADSEVIVSSEAETDQEVVESPETAKENTVVSVKLPVIPEGEDSPFDFMLDPCRLVYETHAMLYGGGTVEKKATLLFHNKEGKYDFSRSSDRLTVTNQGDTPVMVTVSASIRGLKGVSMADSNDFSGSGDPDIYLAIVDDQKNEQPLSADGEISVSRELSSGEYSFGLTGACNPDADWSRLSVHPTVTVTWRVEPLPEEGEEEERSAG